MKWGYLLEKNFRVMTFVVVVDSLIAELNVENKCMQYFMKSLGRWLNCEPFVLVLLALHILLQTCRRCTVLIWKQVFLMSSIISLVTCPRWTKIFHHFRGFCSLFEDPKLAKFFQMLKQYSRFPCHCLWQTQMENINFQFSSVWTIVYASLLPKTDSAILLYWPWNLLLLEYWILKILQTILLVLKLVKGQSNLGYDLCFREIYRYICEFEVMIFTNMDITSKFLKISPSPLINFKWPMAPQTPAPALSKTNKNLAQRSRGTEIYHISIILQIYLCFHYLLSSTWSGHTNEGAFTET